MFAWVTCLCEMTLESVQLSPVCMQQLFPHSPTGLSHRLDLCLPSASFIAASWIPATMSAVAATSLSHPFLPLWRLLLCAGCCWVLWYLPDLWEVVLLYIYTFMMCPFKSYQAFKFLGDFKHLRWRLSPWIALVGQTQTIHTDSGYLNLRGSSSPTQNQGFDSLLPWTFVGPLFYAKTI